MLAVLLGLLLGVLAHVVVFRPLRNSSALSRLVASIGLTVVVQSVAAYRFGRAIRRPKPILPDRTITILDHRVPLDRPLLALTVGLLVVGVWLLLGRTRFGLANASRGREREGGGAARLLA